MEPEFCEFAVDVEIQEGAVICCFDAWLKDTCARSDGSVGGVVGGGFDVGGRGDVEDVDVAVDTG